MWDCVVVGGGAAGLSAALVLGRARRRTLVIDAGRQSNLAAHGIGGLLGHDGRSPAELYETGRRELDTYPSVTFRAGEVIDGSRNGDAFMLQGTEIHRDNSWRERTRRVILATGMQYRPPALPGLAKLWGGSVFACPFCHGWEVRDQPLAVLGAGAMAVHAATLLRGWTDDVLLLTNGPAELDAADRARLAAVGVATDERAVAELVDRDGDLAAIVFADGNQVQRRGLLVSAPLHQRSALAEQLGAAAADPGPVSVNPLQVDAMCRTTAPGVFAAGDLSAQLPQLAAAIAAGSMAAAAVVQSLSADGVGHVSR